MLLNRLLFASIGLGLSLGCGPAGDRVVIGSKNFTEQVILGELLAIHVENELGLPVDRRLNLAGTFLCHESVRSGEIDLYVEYTGTALTAILKLDPIRDREKVYQVVKERYLREFNLEVVRPFGFNNTFAIMIRGEDARKLSLSTISDAAQYTSSWQPGFGYEFLERPDGYKGLVSAYGLSFANRPMEMDLGLMYRALNDGQVDFIAGNSTDGLVKALDLAVLEDNLNYFPPYEAAVVANRSALTRHPGLQTALEKLAGTITDEQMRQMNYLVDGQGQDVRKVAREFLESRRP